MAWKICGLIGTITLGLAVVACDSSSDGTSTPEGTNGSGGGSTTGVTTSGGTTGGVYTGHALNPMNGWISAMDNEAGIQGAFYTFGDEDDGGTFMIEPASYANAGDQICANGTAELVVNMMYDQYWGGAIGFNLNQAEGDDMPPMAFDAQTAGVTGFGFDISALPVGGQLRFNVLVAGEDDNNYCKAITATTQNEFRWEDLQLSCWSPMAQTPDPTRIQAVHWQVVTNETNEYNFDFCVTNLTALTN